MEQLLNNQKLATNQKFFTQHRNLGLIGIIYNFLDLTERMELFKLNKKILNNFLSLPEYKVSNLIGL